MRRIVVTGMGAVTPLASCVGIAPAEISHLNAHATSTSVGDIGELAAIKTLFGASPDLSVSATKSATGHLLGAAGGLGAIFAILALRDQVAPPTLNLDSPLKPNRTLALFRRSPR